MREITDHKLNGLNESLRITADKPGQGNASHYYTIQLLNLAPTAASSAYRINFQDGAMSEVGGANGVSNEALLAIVIDRLRGFQTSEFACKENAVCLTHLETALMWAQKRTRDRMARGVEGTHQI